MTQSNLTLYHWMYSEMINSGLHVIKVCAIKWINATLRRGTLTRRRAAQSLPSPMSLPSPGARTRRRTRTQSRATGSLPLSVPIEYSWHQIGARSGRRAAQSLPSPMSVLCRFLAPNRRQDFTNHRAGSYQVWIIVKCCFCGWCVQHLFGIVTPRTKNENGKILCQTSFVNYGKTMEFQVYAHVYISDYSVHGCKCLLETVMYSLHYPDPTVNWWILRASHICHGVVCRPMATDAFTD